MSRKLHSPQVQRDYRISESRVAKLRLYGGGPRYIKLGRSIIYDSYELDAWLESLKRNSTSEYAS
jgi:predicted DNA-binding transcriptional regulator AlpA